MNTQASTAQEFLRLTNAFGRNELSLSVLCQRPVQGKFRAVRRGAIQWLAKQMPERAGDLYYFVQPLLPPKTGRGSAGDVIGMSCVFADLDADSGKLESVENCLSVVDEVSDVLGAQPAAVVNSGHGLQPYWTVTGPETTWELGDDLSRRRAGATFKKFGDIVEVCAERAMGVSRAAFDRQEGCVRLAGSKAHWVDPGVYELGRVLRVPGTVNYKAEPVPVTLRSVQPLARPVSLDEIDELWQNMIGRPEATETSASRSLSDAYGAGVSADLRRFLDCLRGRGVEPTPHQAIGYRDGTEWRATCPAHGLDGAEHSEAALSFGISTSKGEARLVWHCHGGCTQEEVAKSIDFAFPRQASVAVGRLYGLDSATLAELDRDPLLSEALEQQVRRERVKEILTDQKARSNGRRTPDVDTLDALLARPASPRFRIQGLLPTNGRMLITAQRKAGKTTLIGNLAKALLTGDDFLGQFPVAPIEGMVAVLNYEVDAPTFAGWMSEVGVPGDRMLVINARGRSNPLSSECDRRVLAQRLTGEGATVLMVDPFGRAFTGRDQNNATEVANFLGNLDQLAEEAGITEVILTAHAGWGEGDRARGSSALEDWPDVIVTMTREQGGGTRFIKAEGRDVLVEEDALEYDSLTRHLRLAGMGSRSQVRSARHLEDLVPVVVEVVIDLPGLNTTALGERLKACGKHFQRGDVSGAVRLAEERGLIGRQRGPRNSWLHYPVVPSSPGLSRGTLESSPDPSYRDGTAEGQLNG